MKEIQFLMYEHDETVQVIVEEETIWATQKSMASLFGVESHTITYHLKEIYSSEELKENSTTRKIRAVQKEGNRNVNRELLYYNLDAIISVGYRVNSQKATKFRIWATNVLRDYIQKGFVVDKERMAQGGTVFNKDYFRELLETVRSIRTSERRIWLQITDIFKEISYDYDKNSTLTRNFYALVQNKFHYYLSEKQIKSLERNVSSYFDYIERLLEDERPLAMNDFAITIDEFLKFNRYDILERFGKIRKSVADEKAIGEYKEFNKTQKINSDFEDMVKKLT